MKKGHCEKMFVLDFAYMKTYERMFYFDRQSQARNTYKSNELHFFLLSLSDGYCYDKRLCDVDTIRRNIIKMYSQIADVREILSVVTCLTYVICIIHDKSQQTVHYISFMVQILRVNDWQT